MHASALAKGYEAGLLGQRQQREGARRGKTYVAHVAGRRPQGWVHSDERVVGSDEGRALRRPPEAPMPPQQGPGGFRADAEHALEHVVFGQRQLVSPGVNVVENPLDGLQVLRFGVTVAPQVLPQRPGVGKHPLPNFRLVLLSVPQGPRPVARDA